MEISSRLPLTRNLVYKLDIFTVDIIMDLSSPFPPLPPARLCLCHDLRVALVEPRSSATPPQVAQTYRQSVVPRLPKKWQERQLAFELENLSGIRTHVVDPRPLTLRSAYLKWRSGHYDKAANHPIFSKFLTHYQKDVVPAYPGHLRVFFDQDLIDMYLSNNPRGLSLEWWNQCREKARQQCWTRKGLGDANAQQSLEGTQNDEKSEIVDENVQLWLANAPLDISDPRQAVSVLSDCSMIAAMHPDQATEACVDFALATRKPFAVVPCCVYYKQFSHRTLRDGTPIKTTLQLIQYLKEKDPRIQQTTLGLEGMNQVVYMRPQDF